MPEFVMFAARCVAFIATLVSIFIVFPAIFALNSALMFPIFGLFAILYAGLFYWQVEWFIKGGK